MNIINSFKDPERWSDYNLACFFVHLTLIIIMTFLLFGCFIYNDPEYPEMSRKNGVVASFFDNFTAREGEERLLRKIPSLASDEEYVKTDKFIDLKNGGLWLTERQDGMFGIILIGACFTGVIMVFVGAGPVFRWVRRIILKLTAAMWKSFIFIIPLGVWGAIVSTILALVGYITFMLTPALLIANLVLGIIQLKRPRTESLDTEAYALN